MASDPTPAERAARALPCDCKATDGVHLLSCMSLSFYRREVEREIREAVAAALEAQRAEPIPMLLECPFCSANHVDSGEWATQPHRTHKCSACGETWRPANVNTVGVEVLKENR